MNLRMITGAVAGAALASALAFSASAEQVTVSHLHGETTIETNPETVVVFDLASLDTLDALGVDVAAVPGGVLPSYLAEYGKGDHASVGTVFEPDYEAVAALSDRKSTRLNSSHVAISYAVFCLKKKTLK